MSSSADAIRGSVAVVGAADAVSPDGMLEGSLRALEAEVVTEALASAGLTLRDVDGVACCTGGTMMPSVELAEYLGIEPRWTDSTNTGGSSFEVHVEHAALAIACGLLHSPRVMYFDEPLTGLDPYGIRKMKNSILRRVNEGAAVVISSHLLHLVEEICSHVLILKDGRKVADGTMDDIKERFRHETERSNLEDVFFRATSDQEQAP